MAILKKEGGPPTEKVVREQEPSSRKPETIKVQKVQKAPKPRKTRASHKKMVPLTADEAFEEMANPRSGPGIQARHYRDGRIARADAIEWIACAIIYRRWGKEASFAGWRRHRKAVEEALDRFCEGET